MTSPAEKYGQQGFCSKCGFAYLSDNHSINCLSKQADPPAENWTCYLGHEQCYRHAKPYPHEAEQTKSDPAAKARPGVKEAEDLFYATKAREIVASLNMMLPGTREDIVPLIAAALEAEYQRGLRDQCVRGEWVTLYEHIKKCVAERKAGREEGVNSVNALVEVMDQKPIKDEAYERGRQAGFNDGLEEAAKDCLKLHEERHRDGECGVFCRTLADRIRQLGEKRG